MGRNLADRCTNEVNASMLQSQQEIIGNVHVSRVVYNLLPPSLLLSLPPSLSLSLPSSLLLPSLPPSPLSPHFFHKGLFAFGYIAWKVKHILLFVKINVIFFPENLKPLLPAGIQSKLHTLIPCKKFDLSYDLNCHKLCSDFQEDIVFRFSLGWSSLVHRFLGSTNAQRVLLGLSEPVFQVCVLIAPVGTLNAAHADSLISWLTRVCLLRSSCLSHPASSELEFVCPLIL